MFRKIWSKEESQRIYIHEKVLKANAKTFIETYPKKDVIEIGNFKFLSKCDIRDSFENEEEMNVVIDYLKYIERCDTCSIDDSTFIKFSHTITNVKISEKDTNLLRLHILKKRVLQQTKDLEYSISSTRSSIKALLKNQSRSQAKLQLKRQKRMQNTLDKKLIILHNLELILEGIESASDQADVVNAYKAGLTSLKNVLGRNENEEQVSEILEDMNYYMTKVAEISEAITGDNVIDGVESISDADLNEELETLLACENSSKDDDLIRTLNHLSVVTGDPKENKLKEKEVNSVLDLSNA